METRVYLRILVEDIHSTIVATVGKDGHPVTRCIDMMLYDDDGVYFLTARGKEFYEQLMEQKYISLSAVKDKRCISLAGTVTNIGSEKLDEIFEKNVYMQSIYPGDTRSALEVFRIHDAEGNFFDISDPSHVTRGTFSIGKAEVRK
ncbi:MAG: pyridoxamine 5'-phosphate oxidase family protein, partial [Candidatus Weimeria sp.]